MVAASDCDSPCARARPQPARQQLSLFAYTSCGAWEAAVQIQSPGLSGRSASAADRSLRKAASRCTLSRCLAPFSCRAPAEEASGALAVEAAVKYSMGC